MTHKEKLSAVDAALARGLDDIEAGRVTPADKLFDELEARYLHMVQDRMKSKTPR